MADKENGVILIADDNEVSRTSMANALEMAGYTVIQAIDGNRAIKVLHEQDVLLVIVENYMSPMGGLDVAKHVKTNRIVVPMIMVTNNLTSDLLIQVSRHGIKHCLEKPVEPARLLEFVNRTLKGYKKTRSKEIGVEQTIKKTFSQKELMARAIELARNNVKKGHGGPFGALVADKEGHILGEGVNGITSRCDPMAHAEVMAIRQATEKLGQTHLEGCDIYSSGEPTAIGQALIISVGIDKVYYGLSHEDVGRIRSHREDGLEKELIKPRRHRDISYETLGYYESLEMFKTWEAQKDGKLID